MCVQHGVVLEVKLSNEENEDVHLCNLRCGKGVEVHILHVNPLPRLDRARGGDSLACQVEHAHHSSSIVVVNNTLATDDD